MFNKIIAVAQAGFGRLWTRVRPSTEHHLAGVALTDDLYIRLIEDR